MSAAQQAEADTPLEVLEARLQPEAVHAVQVHVAHLACRGVIGLEDQHTVAWPVATQVTHVAARPRGPRARGGA